MIEKTKIIRHLEKDIIRNCNFINFIEDNTVYQYITEGNSVLVKGRSDENWLYISSTSQTELKKLMSQCNEDEYFAVVEDWMIPFIMEGKMLDWKLSCVKLYFPDNLKLPSNKGDCDNQTVSLVAEEAEYIYSNYYKYQQYVTAEYIRERIKKGVALGIYEDGKLAAWIMTHDDGAIGLLNVLEDYRKKGYGYKLTIEMIKRLRKNNKIPFVHIENDNEKSMNLALKVGFCKYGDVHWIKRINK